MATISRFEEIEAWKTARQLSRVVYQLTKVRGFAQSQSQFQQVFDLAEQCSRQISRFMSYLSAHPATRRTRKL